MNKKTDALEGNKNERVETYKNLWVHHVKTAESIYNEIEKYRTDVINNIEKMFVKMYRIKYWIVILALMFPVSLFTITTQMSLRFFFPSLFVSIALVLLIIFFTILYSGYKEVQCRLAIKKQTILFIYKLENILAPLGIVNDKFNRNMFSNPNADYEIDLVKLHNAMDKIMNLDLSEIYAKPYINYSFLDHIKGIPTKEKKIK